MVFPQRKIKKDIKLEKTLLTLEQFTRWIKEMPDFQHLAKLIGEEGAEETVKDMHWDYTRHGGEFSFVPNGDWKKLAPKLRKSLIQQREKARTTLTHINLLCRKAMTGQPGRELRKPANIMPMRAYSATATDSDLLKGAKWIVNASTTLHNKDLNINMVANVINKCRDEKLSVFDLSTLEFLHNHLALETIPARRIPHPTTPYPSTGGAKALQKMVPDKVRSLRDDARKGQLSDTKWDSLACYFLGAYLLAHGFPDGNGRPSRALYVLTMMEGSRPFVAPKPEFTNNRLMFPPWARTAF